MDFRKKLIVAPGSKFRLASVDPTWHGKDLDEATAKADLTNDIARLTKLQYELYAERRHAVLIVLQGIDAAGKDGTCWHVMTAMNPQGASGRLQAADADRTRPQLPLAHSSRDAGQG